jgi:GNAT superfamily N-acetyltransferase
MLLVQRAMVRDSIVEGSSELVASCVDLSASIVGPERAARIAALIDETNPQRRRSSLRFFQSPGRAHVAAIVNPRLVENGRPVGLLGFFESKDDISAATAVLGAAVNWLRERGATIVRGPINYSTWNDYRFRTLCTEPGVSFAGEPFHPDYYPRLWEAAGFRVATNYGSYWFGDLDAMIERYAPRVAASVDAGVEIRSLRVGDLPMLYQLAISGFRNAYMYSPIEPDEFASIYGADRAAESSATSFVAVHDGKPIGFQYNFIASLPSGPVGVAKTIAVSPEARGRSTYHALMSASYRSFLDAGMTRAIAALIHEDGEPAKMGLCVPDNLLAKYALYEI